MPQAQPVCFIMPTRARARDPEGHRPLRRAHVLQGHERRPTARAISAEIDGIGGEFERLTGKEFTGYACAAGTDVALDVPST
jgi:hypothetical protein